MNKPSGSMIYTVQTGANIVPDFVIEFLRGLSRMLGRREPLTDVEGEVRELGAVMLLRLLLPALGLGEPFGQVIRIVVGVVVAIVVVIFVWKLAECSGLMRIG